MEEASGTCENYTSAASTIRSMNYLRENSLQSFLNPPSVALFGSIQEGSFFGPSVIIKDLQKWNYGGAIYPVHPSVRSVYGLRAYQDLFQAPDNIALAVIITSWRHVPDILKRCGRKGIKAAVVVSDGIGETGEQGRIREKDLLTIAREYGIRIIGPNTLGVFNAVDRFTTMPYEKGYDYTKSGPLSIVTQTGMYGPQAVALNEYQFGLNKIIDLGNMCDIDEVDCLEYLAKDPGTEVISLYFEHTKRSDQFLDLVKRISPMKPVLCLKGGRSARRRAPWRLIRVPWLPTIGSMKVSFGKRASSAWKNIKTFWILPSHSYISHFPRETASESSRFQGPSEYNALMQRWPRGFPWVY